MLNIFNIQRFSTHDGVGIRTNIFFKGCPLNCPWCSNPESRSHNPNLLFDNRLCKKFGDCVKASSGAIYFEKDQLKINPKSKVDFEELRDVCATKALTVAGEKKSIESIFEHIEKDRSFYSNSKGGVTLTGGEPFAQNLELLDLVKELKAKEINVAVETSLHVPWHKIEPHVPLIDFWLADIKHVHPDKFKKFTGGNIALIMENFRKLDALGANIIARVPVIPGFNHTISEMRDIIDFASSLPTVKEIHFMPYHSLGESKYRLMGTNYQFIGSKKMGSEELSEITDYATLKNLKYRIGG